jgi:hypothetical protein
MLTSKWLLRKRRCTELNNASFCSDDGFDEIEEEEGDKKEE